MNRLLSLTLTAITALSVVGCATVQETWQYHAGAQTLPLQDCRRLARPGDTKIRIYCDQSGTEQVSLAARVTAFDRSRRTCRTAADLADNLARTFCGTPGQWDVFDTWAVNAGVTCRWPSASQGRSWELCLTNSQWRSFETGDLRPRSPNQSAFATPHSSWPSPGTPPSSSGFGYATSYGYSSNGIIGQ